MSSEASPPEKEVVGGGLFFGLYFWLEIVLPVERIVYGQGRRAFGRYVDLFGGPFVETQGLDFGDMGSYLSMDGSAPNTYKYPCNEYFIVRNSRVYRDYDLPNLDLEHCNRHICHYRPLWRQSGPASKD